MELGGMGAMEVDQIIKHHASHSDISLPLPPDPCLRKCKNAKRKMQKGRTQNA